MGGRVVDEELMELAVDHEVVLANGLDAALVGIGRRCGQPAVAVYDYNKVVEILMEDGLNYEEAVEHAEFNIVGAWVGSQTPVWLIRAGDGDSGEGNKSTG